MEIYPVTLYIFLIIFFSHIPITVSKEDQKCPFNHACTCHIDYISDKKIKYYSVICEDLSTFPDFKLPVVKSNFLESIFSKPNPPPPEYEVYRMTLKGNIEKIPANAFSFFKSIDNLVIIQDKLGNAEWDKEAFQGIKIEIFNVTNLPGLLNQVPALQVIGENGLKKMYINSCSGNIGPNAFSKFNSLEKLQIENTQISTIDDSAFVGVNKLIRFVLKSSGLIKYPQAINNLVKLKELTISEPEMTQFQTNQFITLQKLETLKLDGSNIQAAVDSGSFNELPKSLEELYLRNGNLVSITPNILSNTGNLRCVYLDNNYINSIKKGDFLKQDSSLNYQLSYLNFLYLNNNPITKVEHGAFDGLLKLESISMDGTNLSSFDLSILNGKKDVRINLSHNQNLKSIILDNYTSGVKSIDLGYTSMKSLDTKFKELLDTGRLHEITISGIKDYKCDESSRWMGKYMKELGAFRKRGIVIDRTTICDNANIKLEEYLQYYG